MQGIDHVVEEESGLLKLPRVAGYWRKVVGEEEDGDGVPLGTEGGLELVHEFEEIQTSGENVAASCGRLLTDFLS